MRPWSSANPARSAPDRDAASHQHLQGHEDNERDDPRHRPRREPGRLPARRLVRLPGSTATDVLDAVLSVLPLDDFVDRPAAAMDAPGERPAIYPAFEAALARAEGRPLELEPVERFAFYDRAKAAYAVIATGERRLYANIILKKGVLRTGDD